MVSRELITEEALTSHLSSPEFNDSLQKGIAELISSMMSTDLASLVSSERTADSKESAVWRELLIEIVENDSFVSSISELAHGLLQSIDLSIPVRRLDVLIDYFLSHPDSLERFVENTLGYLVTQDLDIGKIASPKLMASLEELLVREIPYLGRRMVEFLRKPTIKKELEVRGVHFLRNVFDKFNGVQRFFITAGQYDITLEENMGEIVGDLTSHVESLFDDEKNSLEIARTVRTAIEEKKNIPIADLLTAERIHGIATSFTSMLAKVPGEALKEFLLTRDGSIHSTVLTKDLKREDIEDFFSRIIRSWLHKEDAPELSLSFSSENLLSAIRGHTLASYVPLSGESRDRISGLLSKQILLLIEKKAKNIIETLDVYSLVVNKIDSLDIASVEKLLLQVIERHLKWINLFGALLGGIIGAIQIFLRMVGL